MALPLAAVAAIAGGLGAAGGGANTSGGPASFGGVSVGSKVVGSGTAATVPPPQNAAEASVYTAMAGKTSTSWLNSPNLPIIGVIVAVALAALLVLWPSRK